MLRGGTIQHGRFDQLCFYSETVGPDWSGRVHLYKYVLVHLYKYVLARSILRPVLGSEFAFPHLAYVLRVGGARVAAPGWSDQLHSYSETVGSDWSGRYGITH
jgi:hypothetical protein